MHKALPFESCVVYKALLLKLEFKALTFETRCIKRYLLKLVYPLVPGESLLLEHPHDVGRVGEGRPLMNQKLPKIMWTKKL